ncbi:MAG: serine/threonine protein kinase [Polyangiaceae bacterium]|nr:serine/threonine protein kinase [Polyangiaceae bacterium]
MLKPGDSVDRYRIEDPIGEGGMGRVFRALDERLERRVALKVLHDAGEGNESRARLVREARAVAKLDHPNIVSVFDVGEHEAGPFVVMELIEGRSLRSVIADPNVAPAERVRIMSEVARALAVAHDAGIVHRDVKPENVLVRPDGRVKVVDFGIARRTSRPNDPSAPTDVALSTLTAAGVKVGTPMYMAPEQIRGGDVDGRADQFAWGVTAYELFVGKAPWSGDAMALIAAILTEEPPPPPPAAHMPQPFASVVHRALSKRAEDRFASMHELLATLDATSSGASVPPADPMRGVAALPSLMGAIPSPVVPAAPMYGAPIAGGRVSFPPVSSSPAPYSAPYAGPPSYVPQSALSRRYSTKEVADIFDRALAVQQRRFRYDEIAEAAREVGLDERTLQDAMHELSKRGSVEPTDQQRAADKMRVKRLLAIWGVFAAFFFLLNIFEPRDLWFQYPVICMGVPFGLAIVRILFRAPKPMPLTTTADPAIEHDVSRMTHYFRGRPASPSAEPKVRINAEQHALSATQIEAEANAELAAIDEARAPVRRERSP